MRLHGHRAAHAAGDFLGPSQGGHGLATRHGDAGLAQQRVGEILVGSDADRDMAGLGGKGGLDPLLVLAEPELEERGLVSDAGGGDAATLGRVHDGRGGGPEGVALAPVLEIIDVLGELLGVDVATTAQGLDDLEADGDGLLDDLFELVGEDDVVEAGLALHLAGLAETHFHAGQALKLDQGVLQDMGHVRALVEPLDEAAAVAQRAAMLGERGDERGQLLGEAGDCRRGDVVQVFEVDDQPVGRPRRPDVRTTQDTAFEDLHGFFSCEGRG
ncbi:hypothetical protein D3C87_825110 [compost metagenome]